MRVFTTDRIKTYEANLNFIERLEAIAQTNNESKLFESLSKQKIDLLKNFNKKYYYKPSSSNNSNSSS
jgi:hypothetical protein